MRNTHTHTNTNPCLRNPSVFNTFSCCWTGGGPASLVVVAWRFRAGGAVVWIRFAGREASLQQHHPDYFHRRRGPDGYFLEQKSVGIYMIFELSTRLTRLLHSRIRTQRTAASRHANVAARKRATACAWWLNLAHVFRAEQPRHLTQLGLLGSLSSPDWPRARDMLRSRSFSGTMQVPC